MWPAISAENGDAFEALSRSFGYSLQRPFHYLFYAVIATLFAALCWIFVAAFAMTVVHIAWWGASWGAGYDYSVEPDMPAVRRVADLREIVSMTRPPEDRVGGTLWTGTRILRFWDTLVYSIASAIAYSLFFCLASAIYLLLRQVDDETEFDEVYMEDEDERFTLPEVKRDSAGVPTMTTPSAPATPPASEPERPLSEEE
jgi:hypothetical protein